MSDTNGYTEMLVAVRNEFNRLATDDVGSVLEGVEKMLGDKIAQDPYLTLGTALGIGYGLSALDLSHVKFAAIRVGKLLAMKAISNLESSTQQPGTQQDIGGEDESQSHQQLEKHA